MNKLFVIIQREFLAKVRKKSFILLTVLMPFIFAALIFVPLWLSSFKESSVIRVVVVDETHRYAQGFRSDTRFLFTTDSIVRPEYKEEESEVEAVIHITSDPAEQPAAVQILSRKEVSNELLSHVQDVVDNMVRHEKLKRQNVPSLEQIIADVEQTCTVKTVKWSDKGETVTSSTGVATAAGFLTTFLIYMFVMTYGAMVMQSVLEEKTNRIVEVIVSSVKPFQLMMGKIIGVALVGIVQLLIWGIMLTVILLVCTAVFGADTAQAAAGSGAMNGMAGVPAASVNMGETAQMLEALVNLPYLEMGVLFVLYFVGGYLLYASFFAAVGASVTQQEDASQFMMPVILLMIFGLYSGLYSVENTDGPLAFWASLFPLTSPIVMMVRIPFHVPFWQELLSVGLLYATALFFVWVGAKIYRVGILMYGKKPSVKEMLKWIRYK